MMNNLFVAVVVRSWDLMPVGVLPIMACTGRFYPKGVPF